jgi:UDP-glucose 4-epimerase
MPFLGTERMAQLQREASFMNVLVTGGAGYIGSHAVRKLLNEGHRVVVVDDLSHGHRGAVTAAGPDVPFIHGSVSDPTTLNEAFRILPFEAVLHFAAFIEVGESVVDPSKYYQNNFVQALGMLDLLRTKGIRKIVFSSTAAVYGDPEHVPIPEDARLAPINPYGRSKRMVEMALEDYAQAYGIGYAILRYFNVAGASPEGDLGEAHEPESHLIPRILAAARMETEPVSIFGTDYPTPDGTCVRDYIHVEDLVHAHVLALRAIQPGKGQVYNLGSERGFSVREVLAACEKVLGRTIPSVERPRRPGDPAVLLASSERARTNLGWKRQYPELETMVRHAWQWHERHPLGFGAPVLQSAQGEPFVESPLAS